MLALQPPAGADQSEPLMEPTETLSEAPSGITAAAVPVAVGDGVPVADGEAVALAVRESIGAEVLDAEAPRDSEAVGVDVEMGVTDEEGDGGSTRRE